MELERLRGEYGNILAEVRPFYKGEYTVRTHTIIP